MCTTTITTDTEYPSSVEQLGNNENNDINNTDRHNVTAKDASYFDYEDDDDNDDDDEYLILENLNLTVSSYAARTYMIVGLVVILVASIREICLLNSTDVTNAKGGVAAWPDVPKPGATLGNLTPADRHGSVQYASNLSFPPFTNAKGTEK
uniref:Uncharacterized protein n=1 Tax=Glossina pallidipes TaxID=7398 RepID=A0A1A9Z9U3_GLOPL